jgi:glycine oxidase
MIIIIGAGVSGLGVGWALQEAGEQVIIFEASEAGQAATWASAGVIAPWSYPAANAAELTRFQQHAFTLWPDFRERLEAAAGMSIDYRADGQLLVALDDEEQVWLDGLVSQLQQLGSNLVPLSSAEVLALEPRLSVEVTGGYFDPGIHQVENRKLAEALKIAFSGAGGQLHEHCPVDQVLAQESSVLGVEAGGQTYLAETVVMAAGAWSNRIAGLPAEVVPPVRPVKGQMVSVQMELAAPLLKHVILGRGTYLIPRNDGRILIGATVEEVGLDTRSTAAGVQGQLALGLQLMPDLEDLEIVETWAGLRPGSPDGAPILGKTELEGFLLATGHYSSGIMLAPATAQSICELITTGTTPASIADFSLARFELD